MKKMFVAPELQVIALCEEDILTLSVAEKGSDKANPMILDLKDIFNS